MAKSYGGFYKSFISIVIRLMPFIIAVAVQGVSIIFNNYKVDLTVYIISNLFIWVMIISIINKTFLKYYLVGFDQSQYSINKKINSGLIARIMILTASVLNAAFFLKGVRNIYLLLIELCLIVIADAIIEIRIRIYLEGKENLQVNHSAFYSSGIAADK